MEKLNHTNWHSSQALVHGNDVTMHKRHLEKFAISVTPSQIKPLESWGQRAPFRLISNS